MRRLLPTPTVPPAKAAPIPWDCELLIQHLLGVIRLPQPVIQERSQLTGMEIALQNLLPVGSVVEEDGPSLEPIAESLAGCFSWESWTMRRTDVRSWTSHFPYCRWDGRRTGLVSDGGHRPTGGKHRLIRGEGLVAQISNDYGPQLPTVGQDIPGPAVSNYLGAVRSL